MVVKKPPVTSVYARFAGERLADLDLIRQYLVDQVHETITVNHTDAVYAAVRLAASIMKGQYVRATKTKRKYTRRQQRIDAAADGGTFAGGSPDPWPPGTIGLPRPGATQRAGGQQPDPAANP